MPMHATTYAASRGRELLLGMCALQEGVHAVKALLSLASTAIEHMDTTAAPQHAEAAFQFLLHALDLRQQQQPQHVASSDAEHMEGVAVAAFVALTLKLSESKFRPMFLRLLDWSTTSPASAPGKSL